MIKFIDIVARTLPASRLKAIAGAMLLSEEEEYLLIERCAKMKTREQCCQISPRRQRELMPILNTKFQLWVLQALDEGSDGFFTIRELKALRESLEKHKQKRRK